VMMETGSRSDRNFCRENAIKEDIEERLDEARNERHVM
jgi:hypothetical protein